MSNEDLWRAADQEPVAAQIHERKWGWIGHTLRKPASNITRQALTWEPQGKTQKHMLQRQQEMHKRSLCWKELEKTAGSWVHWRSVVDGL